MDWTRVLHHRYLGAVVICGGLAWYLVQTGRHGSCIWPLISIIAGAAWALDDVLFEEKGWKTIGYWAERVLLRIPAYVRIKARLESRLGGRHEETD